MLDLLKSLIFGSATLLIDSPVVISETETEINIASKVELNVINSGAHLTIDVTKHIHGDNAIKNLGRVSRSYPNGCINAFLISSTGNKHELNNTNPSVSNGKSYVDLTKSGGIPTDFVFTKIKISSCKPIKTSKIMWFNKGK